MSDDSDLLIAAAATAALVTWMGTRRGERDSQRHAKRHWRTALADVRANLRQAWHETPGYVFVQAIRQALRRK